MLEVNSDNFVVISCANCTVEFCITKKYQQRRRDDNARFYCPNGHGNAYNKPKGDSPEVKELKERISNLGAELQAARVKHYDQSYVDFLEDHPEGYTREVKADA